MSTYDNKQVLSDYANGSITVEMAVGHTLQHLDKLYELQTIATMNRYELRGKVDSLESKLFSLQTKVDWLASLVEKWLPKKDSLV